MPVLDSEFVSNELARCNRCGFCIRTCPTYRATGNEASVARSRNELVRWIARGRDEMLEEMHDRFFQCLLCGACTESCLTDVQTDEIMIAAREAYRQRHGEPWIQRFIFRELLPNPDRLAHYVRLIALGKNTGVAGLARTLGLLRLVSPRLAAAEAMVDAMPGRFFRDMVGDLGFQPALDLPEGYVRLRPAGAERGPRVGYFVGCGGNFQLPQAVAAGVRLLAAAGCEVTAFPNVCCGMPPYSYGDREAALALARRNLAAIEPLDCDVVVTECGSCSGFLKQYPKLLADTDLAAEAESVSAKTKDLTEILPDLDLPEPRPLDLRVSYHDPCHLGRKQSVKLQPRELLKRIPGVEYVELPEADWCCGGAGSFNLANPELSRSILDRKMAHVASTKADVLVTACPACVIQLSHGVRRAGLPIQVRHLCEVLAEAHLPTGNAADGPD
jgi:glycolate oxidase iron-sulfur subunit